MDVYPVTGRYADGIYVRTPDGKLLAYRTSSQGGYEADFDATESLDPARSTVWFDTGDTLLLKGKTKTNAYGEDVKILSASKYGMPDCVQTGNLNLEYDFEYEKGKFREAMLEVAYKDFESLDGSDEEQAEMKFFQDLAEHGEQRDWETWMSYD